MAMVEDVTAYGARSRGPGPGQGRSLQRLARARALGALLAAATLIAGSLVLLNLAAGAELSPLETQGTAAVEQPLGVVPNAVVARLSDTQAVATVPVSITLAGFTPQLVAVAAGTTVQWTNLTTAAQRIVGGVPQRRLYLPVISKGGTGGAGLAGDPSSRGAQSPDWGGLVPANGGTFSHTFASVGTYPYYLAADPDLTGTVIVGETVGPNLVVQAVSFAPSPLIISRTFQITLTIANAGATSIARPFRVAWYLDPATRPTSRTIGTYTWTVTSLPAATTRTLTARWHVGSAGVHSFYAQVDVSNVISEADETDNLYGPLQVTAVRRYFVYLPVIFNDFWVGWRSQWRFGFVVYGGRGQVTDYNVGLVRAGWYYDGYSKQMSPPHPAGLEYMQTVRVGMRPDSAPPSCADLAAYVSSNPGAWWFIGNEPDRPVLQDSRTPDDYARIYRDLYLCIKAQDATAKVAPGGIVQPTPVRLQYLDMILAAYRSRYGVSLPADGWNIHNMILRERSCQVYPDECWGAEIPPGVPATQGMLYDVEDNDSMTYFRNQLVAFRQWMKRNGYQNMPLFVSEYGVNMPAEYGFGERRVINYMYATFNYMLNARDCSLGYAADSCRLVQRWAWYSLNDQMWVPPPQCIGNDCGFNGNLFDPATGQITVFGLAYRNRPYY
jgi:plastocyanin